ncbi:MAG: DUF1559 domain-containing protein [Gemmataceae bacterium]|nr:DUF1559 domain-containing protein [Gemmataceae bacterium]
MTVRNSRRSAFTMVQLLIILAILLFLLGLLLPVVGRVREAAGRTQAMNSLKQIGIALHNFADTYKKLPPAFDKFADFQIPGSVHVYILPYVEQDNVFKQYQQNNADAGNMHIPVFVAPTDPSFKEDAKGIQNFAANLRVFADSGRNTRHNADMPAPRAMEPGNAAFPAAFPDGTSNTMWYATKYAFCGDGGSRYASPPNKTSTAFFGQNHAQEQASPTSAKATFQLQPSEKDCLCTPLMAQSFEKSGLIIALADGSVRHVSASISPATWNGVMHPSDGNVIGNDF